MNMDDKFKMVGFLTLIDQMFRDYSENEPDRKGRDEAINELAEKVSMSEIRAVMPMCASDLFYDFVADYKEKVIEEIKL